MSQNKEIVDFFDKLVINKILQIPDEIYEKIDADYGAILRDELRSANLFRLPKSEIAFFEWLKANDYDVWKDLWENEDDEYHYTVGMVFLPLMLLKDGRGFPICDLISQDNYYFTEKHFISNEAKAFIESSKIMFTEKREMTAAQLFSVEISVGAIDVWHFAYKHRIDIKDAKEAIDSLVEDIGLIHLKDAEHLSAFIQI